jgi:maltose/moltooligosaccharide transporter
VTSPGYAAAADSVGLLFAGYNGVAAIAALLLPAIVERVGRRATYALCLFAGAAGLFGLTLPGSLDLLWMPMVGIGIAWAAVLSLPYALLADALPANKRGVYLGIHNIFLVLPQLVGASLLGAMVQRLFDGSTVPVIGLAAACLVIAGALSMTIPVVRHERHAGY